MAKKSPKTTSNTHCSPQKINFWEIAFAVLIIVLVWFVPVLWAKIGITAAALLILLLHLSLRRYLSRKK